MALNGGIATASHRRQSRNKWPPTFEAKPPRREPRPTTRTRCVLQHLIVNGQ